MAIHGLAPGRPRRSLPSAPVQGPDRSDARPLPAGGCRYGQQRSSSPATPRADRPATDCRPRSPVAWGCTAATPSWLFLSSPASPAENTSRRAREPRSRSHHDKRATAPAASRTGCLPTARPAAPVVSASFPPPSPPAPLAIAPAPDGCPAPQRIAIGVPTPSAGTTRAARSAPRPPPGGTSGR